MFRLTGGHLGKHVETKHTDLNVIICAAMSLLDPQQNTL